MNTYIAVPDPITVEWLTAVLRQSDVLREGKVKAVERETTGAFNSHTSRLLLSYTADAAPGAPERLVLKQNIQTAWGKEAGIDEVKFYQAMASLGDHLHMIVPCYAAAYDDQSENSYLLLQDLTETHRPPITRDQQVSIVEAVPTPEYIEAVIDTLAQFHAYWWNHAWLETGRFDIGYWSRNADRFSQYLQRRKNAWEHLITNEKTWLPDNLRELYEQVFAYLPHYWKQYLEPRFQAKRELTLTHGDAYFANFLCPKKPGVGATYLLDWQSASFDIGGHDLVNLCATFWTSQQRHEDDQEMNILLRYHTILCEYGVTNYSWDDLLTDYQTSLIFWLLMPIQDRYGGSSKEYWWPKMQCLTTAFQEWHCEKLL